MTSSTLVTRLVLSALAMTGIFTVACTQPTPSAKAAEDEASGQTSQALGEVGCGVSHVFLVSGKPPAGDNSLTNGAMSNVTVDNCWGQGLDSRPVYTAKSVPQSSGDPNYCPDQAIYDISNSHGLVAIHADPLTMPTDAASCNSMITTVTMEATGTKGNVDYASSQTTYKWWTPSGQAARCSALSTTSSDNAPWLSSTSGPNGGLDLSSYPSFRFIGEAIVHGANVPVGLGLSASTCIW